jgi:hypothetical protein
MRTRRMERAKSACVEKARGVGRDENASNTRGRLDKSGAAAARASAAPPRAPRL